MLILIVDDDREDREILCDAIQGIDASIKCVQVSDGVEAMKQLTEHWVLPNFIFLDINMPIMDGVSCLSEIKSHSLLRDIPVVMYSTTSNQEEIDRCYAMGAHAFIVKPGDYQKLVEALETAILH